MLREPVWSIEWKHTCIIISYNSENHWILIEVNISACVIQYYNLLPDYELSVFCKFVKTQIKCVDEQLNQDYLTWNSSLNDVSTLLFLIASLTNKFYSVDISRIMIQIVKYIFEECKASQSKCGCEWRVNWDRQLKSFLCWATTCEISSWD